VSGFGLLHDIISPGLPPLQQILIVNLTLDAADVPIRARSAQRYPRVAKKIAALNRSNQWRKICKVLKKSGASGNRRGGELPTLYLEGIQHKTRGRPHREVSFRRRRSLSLIISSISAAGRISIVPHFSFTPGLWEMS
jgi:hypothetical protein